MMAFPCPRCRATLKAPEEKVGAQTRCPHCASPVQVPKPPSAGLSARTVTNSSPVVSAAKAPAPAHHQTGGQRRTLVVLAVPIPASLLVGFIAGALFTVWLQGRDTKAAVRDDTSNPTANSDGNLFAAIDRHALDAPPEAEGSLAALAQYLAAPCKTDQDKARAVYRWVTDRIAYDVESFLVRKPPDSSPAGVLQRRTAVCEGIVNLYSDLARRTGLKVRRVEGWSRNPGQAPERHGWNAVEIDGSWRLLDPTYGAGSINGRKYEKSFKEYYFFVPPAQLIFTHFPNDRRWQLLDRPITEEEFRAQPGALYRNLFELGIAPEALRGTAAEKGFREYVRIYNLPGRRTTIVSIPLSRHFRAGTEYAFELRSEDYEQLTFNYPEPGTSKGTPFIHLENADGRFRGTIKPRKGTLVLYGRGPNEDRFFSILAYDVEE
jgi:transglutaminase-like putative cysteine protease/DNA-directed RNA polymerase subunit RPC12/RpoP